MRTTIYSITFFLLATLFINSSSAFSQNVGINTTTPRKTLEVAGDLRISESYQIGTINPMDDSDDSTFLIQNQQDFIESLNLSNPVGAALGYIQEYIISNAELDWVREFDTGIDAKDYTLITTSASYDLELNISSSANSLENSSLPYTAVFKKGNTWRIIADYPMVANRDETAIGTWTIQTLIFSNDLSKDFGSIDINMMDGTTGSASSPLID